MQTEVFEVPKPFQQKTLCNQDQLSQMQDFANRDLEGFWREQAKAITWFKDFSKVKDTQFHKPVKIEWFLGGKTNVSYNCIDRHLPLHANRVAYIWEPDDVNRESRKITYHELYEEVCRFANVLKSQGIKKGDRVTIYLPMIPEAVFAMLACTRIGAIHSVIFAGFSPESIADRIKDCDSHFVITADAGFRGGKVLPLKQNVDEALLSCPKVKGVLVVKYANTSIDMKAGRDHDYAPLREAASAHCPAEPMDSEDPLFILYTSGSTAKPKGVLHTTGGYLVFASFTHKYVFDYKPGQIYWCTADIGWVTGHSYIVYGPLANAATSVLFEGVPHYPNWSRLWEVVDKHQVEIFYTAPTAIRALMREGDAPVTKTSRKSLKLLGSVGEPINPEAWLWYHRVVGSSQLPIVDTWWQTETGGILISPMPGATKLKPGSATFPLPGIRPVLVDEKGVELQGEASGNLCIKESWPGQARTVYGDHSRFEQTYFSTYEGMYFTGDGCRRDQDGYYWITGRVDDVLNVSGHRLGTAEIESALVSNPNVSESAVVGYPHSIKGQGIYVFVTLKTGVNPSPELAKELVAWVRKHISPIAAPDLVQFAPQLPKTRSGKIMRRILRKIAENQVDSLGDTTTLADPSVVEQLVKNRLNK